MTDTLRIVIGSDDAGFDYKEIVKADLEANGLVASVVDVGVDADGHTAYPRSPSRPTRSPACAPSQRTTASRSSARC